MSHVCDVALKLGQVNPHRLRVRCSQSRIMQGRAAHDNAAGVFRHPATFIVCGGAAKTKSSSLARSMGSEIGTLGSGTVTPNVRTAIAKAEPAPAMFGNLLPRRSLDF